jgi:hypothetical protein
MAEAQRGLRIYLITEEQYSAMQAYVARFPNEPEVATALDLIGTQSIGMLPAADMGNQGQRQAQFEKYRAVIAAAIGDVEPGLVDDPEGESDQERYRDSNPSSDSAAQRKESERGGF